MCLAVPLLRFEPNEVAIEFTCKGPLRKSLQRADQSMLLLSCYYIAYRDDHIALGHVHVEEKTSYGLLLSFLLS